MWWLRRSISTTSASACRSACAAASPAKPAPTITTRFRAGRFSWVTADFSIGWVDSEMLLIGSPSCFAVTVMISVVADVAVHLAAEYPIRPSRVHQDHRQQHESADQPERRSALGGRRLPQREMVRHDHRIEADGDADVGENEEADRAEEGRGLRIVPERAPGEPGDGRGG